MSLPTQKKLLFTLQIEKKGYISTEETQLDLI